MIDPETEQVLISLFQNEIKYSAVAKKLKITEGQLDELIDNYHWIPPLEKIQQICKLERKTISIINEVIQQEKLGRLYHKKQKCCEVSIKIDPRSPRTTNYFIPSSFVSPVLQVTQRDVWAEKYGSVLFDAHIKPTHAHHPRSYDDGFEYLMQGRIAQ
ncbi:MAG: hypothetical protein WCX22_04275 [Methanoregula sp.]